MINLLSWHSWSRNILSFASIAILSLFLTIWLTGTLFWIASGIGIIIILVIIGECFWHILQSSVGSTLQRAFQKCGLIIFGLLIAVLLSELFLTWREQGGISLPQPVLLGGIDNSASGHLALVEREGLLLKPEAMDEIKKRDGILTMPSEWQRKIIEIPGSRHSYLWHGYLHVHDANNFRRTSPFLQKKDDTLRLMVVGDSMTYGYGVDERFIYTTLIEEGLAEKYRVEVLNLGVSGWQSEDILKNIREFLPQLQPDLVFYGVVHNDFLPSQMGQYNARGFEFPISKSFKKYLEKRTRFARFVSDSYDASLRGLGLRQDFFGDILENFDGYQQRFAQDVAEMNRIVSSAGLPPIISIVFDQYPRYNGRGYKISMVAEKLMNEAGMEVISVDDYYRHYDGYTFRVSLWEGHGDELAHAIWASMILPVLEKHSVMQKYLINIH